MDAGGSARERRQSEPQSRATAPLVGRFNSEGSGARRSTHARCGGRRECSAGFTRGCGGPARQGACRTGAGGGDLAINGLVTGCPVLIGRATSLVSFENLVRSIEDALLRISDAIAADRVSAPGMMQHATRVQFDLGRADLFVF